MNDRHDVRISDWTAGRAEEVAELGELLVMA